MAKKNEKQGEKVLEIVKLKQVKCQSDFEINKIYSTIQIGQILEKEIGNDTQESLVMFGLDTKNKINFYAKIFTGGVRSSEVCPRDIFQRALLTNSVRILVAHNHPSGNLEPSKNDIEFTGRLQKAGRIINIPLLDSFIISDEGFFSFVEEGYL